jgi:DNA-binding MarR family transcriptional regulator/GNAT superfamily N-acetyltransferase
MLVEQQQKVRKIRSFNRFYTNLLGLLDKTLLKSNFSLTEVRIMFEINHLSSLTASELVKLLNLDPAYLSRILSNFERKNLIRKEKSNADMRKQNIYLTVRGQKVISELQEKANEQIEKILTDLNYEEQNKLISAMQTIERILKKEEDNTAFYSIRSHKSGDIGYIIYRHGIIYASENQLDETFEAYVAKYMAEFLENYDSNKEHLWVVEKDNRIIGSIAIVKVDEDIAQLRWFLVDPHERRKGIGTKIINEAISFCKNKGFKKIVLGTISELKNARKIYEQMGFQLIDSNSHRIWGRDLTEEKWELIL